MKTITKKLILSVIAFLAVALIALGFCFGKSTNAFAEESVQPDYNIITSSAVTYQGQNNVYYLSGDFATSQLYRMYRNYGVNTSWWQGNGDYANFINQNNYASCHPIGADTMIAYVVPCFGNLQLYGRVLSVADGAGARSDINAKIVLRNATGDEVLFEETTGEVKQEIALAPDGIWKAVQPGDVVYFIAEKTANLPAWRGVIFDCGINVFKVDGYTATPTSLLGATQMPMTDAHNITVTGNCVDVQNILSSSMILDQTQAERYCYRYPDGTLALFNYEGGNYVIPGGGTYEATSTGVQANRVFYSNNGWCGASGMLYYAPANGKISLLGKAFVNASAVATVYTANGQTLTAVKTLPTGEVAFANVAEINNVNIVVGDAMVILFDAAPWTMSSMACAFEFYVDPVLDQGTDVKVSGITLTGEGVVENKITVTEGETVTLTATVAPENAIDKTYTWETSDETVATVENGVVTTLKAGTVIISATANDGSNVKAEVEITVNAAQQQSQPEDSSGSTSTGLSCDNILGMSTIFAVISVIACAVLVLKRK